MKNKLRAVRFWDNYLSLLAMALFMGAALGCDKELNAPTDSLATYIDSNPQWVPHNELVACAAGGQQGFLDDPSAPLSMFFYPKLYSTNFRYYELSSGGDPTDLVDYIEKSAEWEPLFNGFMARFPLADRQETWARVSFVSNDTLWYCKPVLYRSTSSPTLFDTSLVDISFDHASRPTFSWPSENNLENIIYFQIVVDGRGDAVSATYTVDKFFTYYDVGNVVFNVTRPGPVLPLDLGSEYTMILMGIGEDNWVNTIGRRAFTVPRR